MYTQYLWKFYETFTHRYKESLQYRIISDNSQITIEKMISKLLNKHSSILLKLIFSIQLTTLFHIQLRKTFYF